MNTTLVTICIPIYNASCFLDDTLLSIINQSYKNWKLYLINDGSTDESLTIIDKYLNDPRVVLINDGENKGLVYRLNQSVKLVDTKYYARMDADDIMHVDRLKKQIEILESDSSIDLLGTNAYSIDEFNRINGVRHKLSKDIVSCCGFIHPSIMGKTCWFKANPYNIDALRLEDMELWTRTKSYSNFKRINEPLLFYREFGGSYYKKYMKSVATAYKLGFILDSKQNYFWKKQTLSLLVKTIIYIVASIFNIENTLIQRRSVKMNSHQEREAYGILYNSKKEPYSNYSKL